MTQGHYRMLVDQNWLVHPEIDYSTLQSDQPAYLESSEASLAIGLSRMQITSVDRGPSYGYGKQQTRSHAESRVVHVPPVRPHCVTAWRITSKSNAQLAYHRGDWKRYIRGKLNHPFVNSKDAGGGCELRLKGAIAWQSHHRAEGCDGDIKNINSQGVTGRCAVDRDGPCDWYDHFLIRLRYFIGRGRD